MSKIYSASLLEGEQRNSIYGYCQQILFTWIYPLIKIGKDVSLNQQHLENIKSNTWNKYSQFFHYFLENHYSQGQLLKSLLLAFKCKKFIMLDQIGACFIFYVMSVLLFLGQPFITAKSQEFFIYETEDQKPLISSMFLFAIIQLFYMLMLSLIKPFQYFQQSILSVKIQGALQQQLITKTLSFPIARSKHFSAGELINMLQVDITQASNYFAYCYQLIMFPIFLITTGLVFYMTLGKEALIPALGSIVQTMIGLLFGYYYGQIQNNYMARKDKRMKSVDEALIFTKQVKLNCLEEFFENRIDQKRNEELQYLRYQVYMLIFITFMQGFLSVATYEIWFLFAEKLNFGIVTIMMQNYANIAMLLSELPNQLKNYSISQNSVKRIANYFTKESIAPIKIDLDTNNPNAIEFEKAVYSWKSVDESHSDPFEININMSIKKGQFVGVVGNSASGKSTILRSILGETQNKSGRIGINGTVSVAMQEPWILSGSIKENITFMNQFDQRKYDKVIEICGLAKDLRAFKHGDETILGEKGDNLSGGQQKRINLARAIYNDADVYLLDDPLSALDIKVKYQIHKACLKDYLKGKTRVLFTSSLANLQECDQIFIVEDGKILKQGTFAELQNIQIEEYKELIDTQFEEQNYPIEGSEKQDLKASLIQIEDQQKGNISSNILKQIFGYQGGCWSIIVVIIYFLVILGCYFSGNGIMAKEDLSDEEFRSIALVAYLLIQFPSTIVIVMLKCYFLFKGLRTSKILHKKIMNSLLNASFTKFYNTILLGRLMNRLSKDVYNIDLLFPNEVFNLTSVLTQVLFPLIACYLYLNLIALPLVILFFVLLIYLTLIYNRCLREVTRIESVSKSPVFTFFQQVVRGVSYIRTCLKPDNIIHQQQENVNIDISNQICLNGFQYWYQSITGTITSAFQSILFIVCFLFPGQTQRMTNMVLSQMQTVSNLLLQSAVSYGNIQIYSVSFERCLHLVDNIEREQRNQSLLTPSDQPFSEEDQVAIQFDQCSFQYRPNSKCVLQNLTFTIQQREKIGIVGRTGAGKSSIILALTQMLEQIDGSIKINGKNMNEFTISQLRSSYSIIPQEPLVFMGTLEDNLNPFKRYTKEEINEACQNCKLFDLQSFKQFELQSQIAVQGSNLSQGEKQLLNIARCLLQKNKIILIDEATASIDLTTEQLIKEIFEKCFINCTMLTIAHKVTTIMNSDKIMVIDDGSIIEFDHPDNLLKNDKGEFREIIRLIKQSELL